MSRIPVRRISHIPWEYSKREVFFHHQQEHDGRNPLVLYHHTLFLANVLQNKTLSCVSVGPRHESSHMLQNINACRYSVNTSVRSIVHLEKTTTIMDVTL